jgi:FemAB family
MQVEVIGLTDPSWSQTLQTTRHDVYHLPEYILLEARRTKAIPEAILITDGDQIFFVPYLLRRCDDIVAEKATEIEIFDTLSPYGYTGILLSEAATNNPDFAKQAMLEMKQIFRAKGVCSAFFRMHPILNDNFCEIFSDDNFTIHGETISVDLRITESQIWSSTRSGHKSTINKCKRLGMEAKIVPLSEYLDEFTNIYQETMNRVGATQGYYSFDLDYYREMGKILGDKLHLCIVNHENEVACVGIYTEVCGIVQSTLGGTKDKFVHLSPSSLETDYARYWAKERGNEFLHLGGGVGASQDSVYSFKKGFSKLQHTFMTLRLIVDEDKYNYLTNLRAKSLNTSYEKLLQSGFFPAYRSTVVEENSSLK